MQYSGSMKRRSIRRGIVAPFVAICLVALLGVTALAIDGGLLLAERQQVQATADAAALAAGIDLYNNWSLNLGKDPSGTAANSAQKTAADNGFQNGTNNVTVAVHIPPASGTFSGQYGYAEVVVTMQQERLFSAILGSGNLSVQARTVARGAKVTPGIGLLVLNSSANNALHLSATGSVNVTGSVVVDSNSSSGMALSAGGSITATGGVDVTGSNYATSNTGTINGNSSPSLGNPQTIYVNQAATTDPLATFAKNNVPNKTTMPWYSPPNINSFPPAANAAYTVDTVNKIVTFNPGYYGNGLTINDNTPGHTYILGSGDYYFDQNVTFNGYGTLQSGSGGTMIYNNNGAWTNSSQNFTITLTPMSSGTYSNPALAYWQNVNNSSNFNFSNGGNLNINSGILYVPGALMQLSAQAGTTAQLGSQVIVNTLQLSGSGSFNVNANQGAASGKNLYLVE